MSEPVQEVNRTRPVKSGWRWVLVLFLIPIAIHLYMHLVLSRSEVYEQVYLGLRFDDARELLQRENVECTGPGFTSPGAQPAESASCRFEDPWREYLIVFDRQSGEVVSKRVTYKPALMLPARAVRYFFGRMRL